MKESREWLSSIIAKYFETLDNYYCLKFLNFWMPLITCEKKNYSQLGVEIFKF